MEEDILSLLHCIDHREEMAPYAEDPTHKKGLRKEPHMVVAFLIAAKGQTRFRTGVKQSSHRRDKIPIEQFRMNLSE